VLEPKLLILDEVTSALDPETEAEICANIDALKGALTIVAVTHREAWTSIAGRIYKVEGGRVERSASDSLVG
jgi:ATP-binding cassette subfamily C protein